MEKSLKELTKIVTDQDKQIRELKNVIARLDRRTSRSESVVSRLNHTLRTATNNLNVVLKMLRKD